MTPPVFIRDIEFFLPERVITNDELEIENPTWQMKVVENRTGIKQRYISAESETALDLAYKACRNLFDKNPYLRKNVDAILFCTQSPDYVLPPNACVLHKKLELKEKTFALDFNLACSGYIYGLALAEGLLLSKRCRQILLINADTYSRYIHPKDRSTRVLFSDAAAVSLISSEGPGLRILDIECATSGENYDKFIIWAGGQRLPKSPETIIPLTDKSGNVYTKEHIYMEGLEILNFVGSKVPIQIKNLLHRNNLELSAVDGFIFHQASKMVLDLLTRMLKLSPDKVFRNIHNVANTVSASLPISIKEAEKEWLKPGSKIVLSGFGVGLSWGSALVEKA